MCALPIPSRFKCVTYPSLSSWQNSHTFMPGPPVPRLSYGVFTDFTLVIFPVRHIDADNRTSRMAFHTPDAYGTMFLSTVLKGALAVDFELCAAAKRAWF